MGKAGNSVFAVLLLVSMSACGQAVGAPPVSAPLTTAPTTCPASGIREAPQILTVKTDLGTTGEVDVTAWAAKIAQ
jgi:hypothetical protein